MRWAVGEVPMGRGPFPTASSRTRRASFPRNGLSSDHSVSDAGGYRWMWAWQRPQTTRVLRRRFAMMFIQSGRGGPGLPRSVSLWTWWTWAGSRFRRARVCLQGDA